MALIDRHTDTLDIWLEESGTDGDGNPVRRPSPDPVQVTGRLQPQSAGGGTPGTAGSAATWRFLTRRLPPGSFIRARSVSRGLDFDLVGQPQRQHGSTRVAHVVLTLRTRSPEGA